MSLEDEQGTIGVRDWELENYGYGYGDTDVGNTSTDLGSYTGGGSEESVFDPTSVYEITNTATTPGASGWLTT